MISFILQFSSIHSCDAAGLTLACLHRHCPVQGCCWLPFSGASLACQGHAWLPDNLCGSHTALGSLKWQNRKSCRVVWWDRAGCLGWWQEKTYSIFPKSLESKGPVRRSCAENMVSGGFNCDTSSAHSAVGFCASEQYMEVLPCLSCEPFTQEKHSKSRGWQEGNIAPTVENSLWGLSCLNPTRQLQFLSLCVAEGSRMLPASGVKQHVINYWFSVAPLGTSHLFPASPEDPERPYK